MQVSLELFLEFSVAIAGLVELFARIAIYIRVFLFNGIPGGGGEPTQSGETQEGGEGVGKVGLSFRRAQS